jgi:hypothetical protein
MNKQFTGTIQRLLVVLLVASMIIPAALPGSPDAVQAQGNPVPYRWSRVQIGGGGPIPALVVHPLVPDVAYMRMDIGPLYRWEAVEARWIPLLDWVPVEEWWLSSAESVAIDPTDATGQIVYAALGKSWEDGAGPGEVVRSFNQGATWERTGLNVRIGSASPQENERGERLAVDPSNGAIVYYASAQDGLWRSNQSAQPESWETISDLNANFIVFDAASGTVGQLARTRTLYLGNETDGIYQSTDGGASWTLMVGSPAGANRARVTAGGVLYVTYDQGVMRYIPNGQGSGTWEEIAPVPGLKYVALAVDPADNNYILTVPYDPTTGQAVYQSIDGGSVWRTLTMNPNHQLVWTPREQFAVGVLDLTFDPLNPGTAWLTDHYFAWQTTDIRAETVQWTNVYNGHEGMVTTGALVSPPTGDFVLMSGVGEQAGFDHSSLMSSPDLPSLWDRGMPVSVTTGIDYQEDNPNFLVRVGRRLEVGGAGTGAYSLDGGQTYTAFGAMRAGTMPYGAAGGRVAISATSETMVWAPQNGPVVYSGNRGSAWWLGANAPSDVITGEDVYTYTQPLAADRVLGDTFYIYVEGLFYRSADGGTTWETTASLPVVPADGFVNVVAAPDMGGEVWVGLNEHGLYRSADAGDNFQQIPAVETARLVAFGASPPGVNHPTVFLYGVVNGVQGVFRSDDMGDSWLQIDIPEQRIGQEPNTMAGDRQVFGRVYIGTSGSGILYGEPDVGTPFGQAGYEIAVPALAEDGAAVVPLTQEPVVIDGDLDENWFFTEGIQLQNDVIGGVTGFDDFSASVHLLYDLENLYLLFIVLDERRMADSTYSPWDDDSVEVFLDGANNRGLIYDFDDEQYVFVINSDDVWTQQGNSLDVESATLETPYGYQMEVKIPWLNVGVIPFDGLEVGFDIHVNDDDDGGTRDTKLAWYATSDNSYQLPRMFGTLRISGLIVGE